MSAPASPPSPPPRPAARVPDERCVVIVRDGAVLIPNPNKIGRPGRPIIDEKGVVYRSIRCASKHLKLNIRIIHDYLKLQNRFWYIDQETARTVFDCDSFGAPQSTNEERDVPEPARASQLMPLPPPRTLTPTARVPDKPCTVVLWDNDPLVHVGAGRMPGRPGRPVIDERGVVYASIAAAGRHLGKDTSTLHKQLQEGRNLWPIDGATARAVFEAPTFPPTAPTPAPTPTPTPTPTPSTCMHVWQAGSERCVACGDPRPDDGADALKAIKDLLDDFDVSPNPDLTTRLRAALLEMEAAQDLLRETRALLNPEK